MTITPIHSTRHHTPRTEASTPSASPLIHRAVLPVRGTSDLDALALTRQYASAWIARKHPDADPLSEPGSQHLNGQAIATVALTNAHRNPDGADGVRVRLREENSTGLWLTTATAVQDESTPWAWVCVDLEHLPSGGAPVLDRPRLIRDLVDALPVWDGPAKFSCHPQLVTAERVESLLAVLTHVDRRFPAVVAARPLEPNPHWSRRLKTTVRRIAGSASIYLLNDAQARQEFARQIGSIPHRVDAGAIRTYLPQVDPAWASDAHRHRVLSAERMQDPRDQAWKSITHSIQGILRTQPLPSALRSTRFSETTRARRGQAPAQEASTASPLIREERLREDVGVLEELLTESSKENEQLQEQIMLAEQQLAATRDLHEQAERTLDTELSDHLATLDELAATRDENQHLRNLLAEAGRSHEAYTPHSPADATLETPSTFEELLTLIPRLERLCSSGDRETTLELDTVAGNKAALWARKTWEALRALDSYARVQAEDGFAGSFYEFCRSPPDRGRPWSPQRVAMSESGTTLNSWGHERVFPVPPEVDPTGKVRMEAHLKIDSRGSISPRVYFLDRCADLGVIAVGSIGRHLRNTRT